MPHDPLTNLGLTFVFICLGALLAYKLKFSSIPFLILLGMLTGPNAPQCGPLNFRLIAETEFIELMARLGVLFLLFYLGLEFPVSHLTATGLTLVKSGTIYVGLNFLRGLAFGWLVFCSWPETLVVAGITTISSSAIVTKLLVDLKRIANPETELILGIMVYEDFFLAAYLSFLFSYLDPNNTSAPVLTAIKVVITFTLILAIIFFTRRLSHHLDRWLSLRREEAFVVTIFTLLLVTAAVVKSFHLAEAIGALLLGFVLAETSQAKRVVQLVIPFRDIFGAAFFFWFGLSIDYHLLNRAIWITVAAVAVTVVGNLISGYLAAHIAGHRGQAAANVALTIMARGEFAVIVASTAAAAGINGVLQSFAAFYVLALAMLSPVLAKKSQAIYQLLRHCASRVNRWKYCQIHL